MNGDKAARTFEKLLGDFLDAAAERSALGLEPSKGRLKDATGERLAPWLVSIEGRSAIKKTLAAMKAERRALKAVLRFSRKRFDDTEPAQADATSANENMTSPSPSHSTPDKPPSVASSSLTPVSQKVEKRPRVPVARQASPTVSTARDPATVMGAQRKGAM